MRDLKELQKKAQESLANQQGLIRSSIRGDEFSPEEIAEEMERLQAQDADIQKSEAQNQEEMISQNESEFEDRIEKNSRLRSLGLLEKADPKLAEHAFNIFPSLKEFGMKPEVSPMLDEEEEVSREPAEEEVSEEPELEQEEISRKPAAAEKQVSREPAEEEEPASQNIEGMLKKAREEQDRASTAGQFAKLRDAIIGVGARRPIASDTSMYEERKKEALRPIEDMALKEELQSKQAKNDPNSQISKLMRNSLSQMGISMKGLDKISYSQLEKLYPSLVQSLYNKISLDTKNQLAKDKLEATKLLKQQEVEKKKREGAKISDKQLTPISDVDSIIANLDNVMSLSKEKFTGPLDARLPDILTSGEEAAFRSAVGRMTDSYRKAITGAGASAMELQKLESRLPDPKDTLEQFKAKSLEFRKELVRNRNTYLNTLKKQGKDVSEFEQAADLKEELSPEEKLKKYEDMIKRAQDLQSRRGK